jgi:hypothetical protein
MSGQTPLMFMIPSKDRFIKGREGPWPFPPRTSTGSTPRRVGLAVNWLSPGRLFAPSESQGFFLAGADICRSPALPPTALQLGVPI